MRELDLAFPADEYDRRLATVRARMATADLELLIVSAPENICYLAGYESVGYFAQQAVLIAHTGAPILMVRALELPNAQASSVFERIIGYEDHETGSAAIARAIADAHRGARRIGTELRYLTGSQLTELEALLPNRTLSDSFGIVEGMRLRKSARELDCIRRAGRNVEAGMRASLNAIRAGARERDVAVAASQATIAAGSEWTGTPVFVSSGPRSARAHTTWSDRILQPGDPVFVETNAAVRRYHAALMRPACIAPVPARFQAMMDASRAALEAALAAIRPGVPAAAIDRACRNAIAKRGFADSFRLRTGYSMGLGFQSFGEGALFSLHQGNSAPLETGMVLHIVPYLAEVGFAGGAFSETVIVAEGAEPVTNVARTLLVRERSE